MRELLCVSKLLFGKTLAVAVLCTISFSVCSAISQNANQEVAQNQTEPILDNLNATVLMKRAGEFASRVLWVKKRKFIFPTGTILTLAPKITVPAFRQKALKGSLNSDFQATWFLYLNMDKLGYTHDMHPFPFDRPPFYPFGSLMRPIEPKDGFKKKEKEKEKEKDNDKDKKQGEWGNPMQPVYPMDPYLNPQQFEYKHLNPLKSEKPTKVVTYFPVPLHKRAGSEAKEEEKSKPRSNVRKPRSVMSLPPPDSIPGGERATLISRIEDIMSSFGFEGRGCMLRAICEIHDYPMQGGYGLLGEMIALFFSISESPYAESHMPEYLKAEVAGRAGNCAEYKRACAKSIFKWETVKKGQDELEENEVPVSLLRSKQYSDYDEL